MISNLKKENFDLKMKIHFFEQQVSSRGREKEERRVGRGDDGNPDASFASFLDREGWEEDGDGDGVERDGDDGGSIDRLSFQQDPTSNEEQHQEEIKGLENQHQVEMEKIKEEFLEIAQQACQDIQELHDRIAEQQETIQTLQSEREYHQRQNLILEGTLQVSNNPNDIQVKEVQVQTDEPRTSHIHIQTLASTTSNTSTTSTTATSTTATHDEFIQTLLSSFTSRNISCQTDFQQSDHKPAMLLPNPQTSGPISRHVLSSSQLEEYEKNKQRYIDELKERNTLLIRIIQHFDSKLGTGHIGQLSGVQFFRNET